MYFRVHKALEGLGLFTSDVIGRARTGRRADEASQTQTIAEGLRGLRASANTVDSSVHETHYALGARLRGAP